MVTLGRVGGVRSTYTLKSWLVVPSCDSQTTEKECSPSGSTLVMLWLFPEAWDEPRRSVAFLNWQKEVFLVDTRIAVVAAPLQPLGSSSVIALGSVRLT